MQSTNLHYRLYDKNNVICDFYGNNPDDVAKFVGSTAGAPDKKIVFNDMTKLCVGESVRYTDCCLTVERRM